MAFSARDIRAEVEEEFAALIERREYDRACVLLDQSAFSRARRLERPHGAGEHYVIEPLAMAPLVSCAYCRAELLCRIVFPDDAGHQAMGHGSVCLARRAAIAKR